MTQRSAARKGASYGRVKTVRCSTVLVVSDLRLAGTEGSSFGHMQGLVDRRRHFHASLTKVRGVDAGAVAVVRRFSRLVTARVGALDEDYLARSRPLGQARVLWEIGRTGCEVRVLRARLGLDSGQLSRTLRTFENEGLVSVSTRENDTRVRVAALTAAGAAEWDELEEASESVAATLLDPLTERQRDRLITAMGIIERLVLASLVEVTERPPTDPLARACLRAYHEELEQHFGGRFDAGGAEDHLAPPDGLLLVAVLQGEPVGCGGLLFATTEPPEIKRLWTAHAIRGTGLGRRLLLDLERRATGTGASSVRLDTNGGLSEALALYRSSGYAEIPPYNDNPHAHHWFEKRLG